MNLENIIYERIKLGKSYDLGFKPYSEIVLRNVLNYFEEKEEFEKCELILKHLNKLNHDNGYININYY
jgi:chemotaxis methyl-accepting protein methylase